MRLSRIHRLVTLLSSALIVVSSCDDPAGPPPPGAIRVIVSPSGPDLQSHGYRASVDNGPALALDSLTVRFTFFQLEPGPHTVRLEGLQPNCTVAGQNPMSVTVESDRTTLAQFNVTCVANAGSVRVTTVTTGGELDPNGYEVSVDGVRRANIGINASVTISDVRTGQHAVSLGDVASNCTVSPSQPASVNVAFNATVEVGFLIACAVPGSLEVTVATTGVDVDPNGYTVHAESPTLDVDESLVVASNGSVTFRLRPANDYKVTLQGVSANCHIVGAATQTVAVVASTTTRVAFTVSCEAQRLLAIEREADVYVISSNGTGVTRLTTDPGFDGQPAWASTGRIAFVTSRHNDGAELYTMNEDGTGAVRLTTSAGDDVAPSWSPDGQRIVFESWRDNNGEIYVVNADGTGLTRLTNNAAVDRDPAWSSTGKIAFVSTRDHDNGEIYVMNADGSNVIRLTTNVSTESGPAWSPDGSMIAFSREIDCYYYCSHNIFVMNADGSNGRQLTTTAPVYSHGDPSWSPSGRVIAFTSQYCPYYCELPTVWTVDVQGTQPSQVTDNGARPAWKP